MNLIRYNRFTVRIDHPFRRSAAGSIHLPILAVSYNREWGCGLYVAGFYLGLGWNVETDTQ